MIRIKLVLSEVLKVDVNEINDESSPDNIASWDSFTALLLITTFEEKFKIRFTAGDIIGVKNVGDIRECIKGHGIEINCD